MTPFSMVYVPCKDKIEAEEIAQKIVKARLAFCVNIIPNIHSVYTWKGKIEEGEEALIIVKTRSRLVSKAIQLIKKSHSYDLPDILVWKIEKTTPEVEKWLNEEFK